MNVLGFKSEKVGFLRF